jgi:hypothetical protein
VAIRCPFCHFPGEPNDRERCSIYYPATISSIYHTTMNLLQHHLYTCPFVPDDIMERYETLKGDNARSGTSKKYWVESAISLGLVDTPSGIRYVAPTHTETNVADQSELFEKEQATSNLPENLVEPEDQPHATSFLYELMLQTKACCFTEADRLGKRRALPHGYAGLACRHCFGGHGVGCGRFFPSSVKTLSDTSKTLNVLYNHMLKCRKCPPEVSHKLEKLRSSHEDERSKMKFGSQKAFFKRIWTRLHCPEDDGGDRRSSLSGMKRRNSQVIHNYPQQQPPRQDSTVSGEFATMGGIVGLRGIDVLSRQAASAAQEGSPSKRRRT